MGVSPLGAMRFAPLLLVLALVACEPNAGPAAADPEAPVEVDLSRVAEPTSTVVVAYKGRLDDGTVFDESDRATFSLLRVIPGFQTAIAGMHVGESKAVSIPPEEGYGDSPPPGIPPGATLNFEITLLDIR